MKALEQIIHEVETFRAGPRHATLEEIESFLKKLTDLAATADLKRGEPLFVLRGQDVATPDAIKNYREVAAFRGARIDFQQAVADRERDIREWQRLNPDSVKVPD
jgi:hypothetical protein